MYGLYISGKQITESVFDPVLKKPQLQIFNTTTGSETCVSLKKISSIYFQPIQYQDKVYI